MLRYLLILILALASAPAGADSIVLAVNPDCNVGALSRAEVINIFLGGFRRYPSGLTAVPIDLPRGDPVREAFYRRLVHKSPPEINAYWARVTFSGRARPPIQAKGVDEVNSLVLKSENSIAYLQRSQADSRLKIVLELPEE